MRRPPPAGLRRVDNPIAVPAEERACPTCGKDRTCIGHDPTEVIELFPAEVIVRIDRREVLVCEPCEGELERAPLGDKLIARGIYGSALVSTLFVRSTELGGKRHEPLIRCAPYSIPCSSTRRQAKGSPCPGRMLSSSLARH